MQIGVVHGDVQSTPSDLLVLKNAEHFHGADKAVAEALGFPRPVAQGTVQVLSVTGALKPKQVAFIGVGALSAFRYDGIRRFGIQAIRLVADAQLVQNVRTLSITSHGVGTGLDEGEAFKALLAGIRESAAQAAQRNEPLPQSILIVEQNERRVQLFQRLLNEVSHQSEGHRSTQSEKIDSAAVDAGSKSDASPKLFAAMPFEESYFDEYQIAFLEAANANGFLCERLDLATYVGDVLTEIKTRISGSSGVLALMNDANANVFLEIGYAWAKEKPTLLIVKRGQRPPFDVQGHRYIEYGNIAELRQKLTMEIGELKKQGVLR